MPTPRLERDHAPRGRGLVLASVLFIVAMLASTAHDLWVSHREAEREAGQEACVLARALAEQTHRSMQAVGILLAGIANDQRRGELQRLGAPGLHDYLERTRAQSTGVAAIFLADESGRISAIAGDKPHQPIDMAPAALRRLQSSGDVMVDRLARDTPSTPGLLRVLRRIDGPDGHYAGSAGVLLDAADLEHLYADAQPGLLTVIALLDEEAALFARYPARASGDHGVERLGIAQPVPGYPLRVVVSRDTRLVHAPWREAAWGSAARTLLLSVAASWLLSIVLRQLRRLENARASLARSERALRSSEEEMRLARAEGEARPAGSIEDITDRKRADAGSRTPEMRLRTAQELEAMGTLAGGIAHDFNNVLGAILGFAELAQGHAEPGSALSEQLDGVMKAGLRAQSLAQRILAFSRSGLGEEMPVNAQRGVEEALDTLEASLPAEARRDRWEATVPHGAGERVLVIDDEEALVQLAEETLAALGYEPVGYTSGTAALQAFEQAPAHYDVILTDETMPQLKGSQLAQAVRRLRPDIPVLLMTGYASPVLAARMRTLGIRGVLAKPLLAEDIARALADALAQPGVHKADS